jgi:hypothetical protein
LQDLALACTGIRAAPDYPIEDATALPLSIAHISEGNATQQNASTTQCNLTVRVDFHFARTNIKDTYQRINVLIPEYLTRLGGDPTLNSTIDTIQFPVSFVVSPAQWDAIVTQMVSFYVPFKTLETPVST